MTTNKGPATSPKVSGPIESKPAVQQVSPAVQRTGENPWIAALRAQLGITSSPSPAVRVLAVIEREQWTEVIVACPGCGRPHRHHVGHTEGRPVTRRCAAGRPSGYVVDGDR